MVTAAPDRPVTTAGSGAVVTACAATAVPAVLAPMAVAGDRVLAYAVDSLWVLLPLVVALLATGGVMAGRSRRGRPAAAVSAVLAAQVSGHGVAAARDWLSPAGPRLPPDRLALLVGLAAVTALAGAVAATAATARLWREPDGGRRGLRPRRPAWPAAGAAVAVLGPAGPAAAIGDTALTTAVRVGLTCGLPWGAGLALAGWLGRDSRIAVAAAVALSAGLASGPYGGLLLLRVLG